MRTVACMAAHHSALATTALLVNLRAWQPFALGHIGQHRVAAFEQQTLLLFFIQHAVVAAIQAGVLPLALRFIQDQCRGHGDVERLHHADHRNDDVLIGQRQRFFGDAGFSGRAARRWAGVIHLAEIDRARRQMGGQNLHALRFQVTDRVADGTMGFDADPAVAAGGGGNRVRMRVVGHTAWT